MAFWLDLLHGLVGVYAVPMPPATLIPRMTPTVTPPPTIGYSTRAPTHTIASAPV
ncbi:MAG UNVERIFIED_CONTAM: hypothetical protein LVT10_19235 [Anaerolineae bacterium]